jgi:hypothetical protein
MKGLGNLERIVCHSERSEESLQLSFGSVDPAQTAEILRFAQNDTSYRSE